MNLLPCPHCGAPLKPRSQKCGGCGGESNLKQRREYAAKMVRPAEDKAVRAREDKSYK